MILISAFLALSQPVQLQSVLTENDDIAEFGREVCPSMSRLAVTITLVRHDGVLLADVFEFIASYFAASEASSYEKELGIQLARAIAIDIYRQPRVESQELLETAAIENGNRSLIECLEATGANDLRIE